MSVTLTQKTMRRVYAIWVARALISPIFFKLYAIASAIFGMTRFVSFESVFKNIPAGNDFGAQFIFVRSALFHTEFLTLFLFCVSLAVFAFLCKDILRYVRKGRVHMLSL